MFYEKLYRAVIETQADICFCNLKNISNDIDCEHPIPFKGKKRIFAGKNKEQLQKRLISKETETGDSLIALSGLCCKIIKAEIAKAAEFPENVALGEDTCYIIQLIETAEKILYISDALYKRHIVAGSASNGNIDEDIMLAPYTNWVERFCRNRNNYLSCSKVLYIKNLERICHTYFTREDIDSSLAIKHIKNYLNQIEYRISIWDIIQLPVSCGYKTIGVMASLHIWFLIQLYYRQR